MIRYLLLVFSLLALCVPGSSQHVNYSVTADFSLENKTLYNKKTGKEMSQEDFRKVYEKNKGKISLYPRVDKFGKVYAYDLDPDDDSGRLLPPQEPVVPAGEAVLPFVMTSVDGKTYDSYSLRGKNVLLLFDLFYAPPVFSLKLFQQTQGSYLEHREALNLVMIRLTMSSEEEINEQLTGITEDIIIIPETRNFNQRYGIARIPTCMVIDDRGIVRGYLNQPDWNQIAELLNREIPDIE